MRMHCYTNEPEDLLPRSIRHILFSCLLYLIEFPTLLAKREIIANAFFIDMSWPRPYRSKPMQKYEKTFNWIVFVSFFVIWHSYICKNS